MTKELKCFFTWVFFADTDYSQDGRGGKRIILYSSLPCTTISNHSRILRHLFAVMHLKCLPHIFHHTAQKMKFSIKDFFGKCDQIRSFIFCAVTVHVITKLLLDEIYPSQGISIWLNFKLHFYVVLHVINVLTNQWQTADLNSHRLSLYSITNATAH